MGRTILEMDGKEHIRHRNIIAPAFVPKALRRRAAGGWSSGIVDELIDDFAGDGAADLVSQFTSTFPMRVIAYIIGVPIEDYDDLPRAGRSTSSASPTIRRAASRRRRIWSTTCAADRRSAAPSRAAT